MRHLLLFALLLPLQAIAADLHVGPNQQFPTPAAALSAAHAGDSILIHPQPNNAPYARVALLVTQPNLTIAAANAPGDPPVPLSGADADLSGELPNPRAIVQFEREAGHGTLRGFTLTGAHNLSHNGAGVRVNFADDITITHCNISANDMGIMSNGNLHSNPDFPDCRNLRIEHCHLHHNGDQADPGYNHNLYLGGFSVTLFACEVDHPLTGHNVKSRAHLTTILYCRIHDSANREIDLVDQAAHTTIPHSDAYLIGNVIVKDPACQGNRSVIHFGNDGKTDRIGTLYLLHNNIVTPFQSPIVDLSAPNVELQMVNCIVADPTSLTTNHNLTALHNGAKFSAVAISHCAFTPGFKLPPNAEKSLITKSLLPLDPLGFLLHPDSQLSFGLTGNKLPLPRDFQLAQPDPAHALDTLPRKSKSTPNVGAQE